MGIWFTSAGLTESETVQYQGVANLFQRWRTVGGQVTVTNERFIFAPNRVDRVTGGKSVRLSLSDITDVMVEDAGMTGLKKRGPGAAVLRPVKISTGETSVAVTVYKPDALVAALGHRQ